MPGSFTMGDLNALIDVILMRVSAPAPGSLPFIAADVDGDNVLGMADLNLFVDRLLDRIAKFPVEP